MCRRNMVSGIALIALGIGLIAGTWLSSGLAGLLLAVGLIAGGILILQS